MQSDVEVYDAGLPRTGAARLEPLSLPYRDASSPPARPCGCGLRRRSVPPL